jgi:hypothetical protein
MRFEENRHARACRGHPRLNRYWQKGVDGRNKSGHDEPLVQTNLALL